MGTVSGDLHVFAFDEREKKGRPCAHLYALPRPPGGRPPAVTGLAQARLGDGRRLALVATPDRLYAFVGPGGSLTAAFESYPPGAPLLNYLAPGPSAGDAPAEGCGALALRQRPGLKLAM